MRVRWGFEIMCWCLFLEGGMGGDWGIIWGTLLGGLDVGFWDLDGGV